MLRRAWTRVAVLATLIFGVACTRTEPRAGVGAGEALYLSSCSSCHQPTGEGLPSVFPPLVRHVPALSAAEGGRVYLIQVLLYGLQGETEVEGATYSGAMPAFGELSDAQLADLLTYTSTAWGNGERLPEGFTPYTPEEVAAQRGLGLSPAEVYEARGALELADE